MIEEVIMRSAKDLNLKVDSYFSWSHCTGNI